MKKVIKGVGKELKAWLAVYGVLTAAYYAGCLYLGKRKDDKYISLVRNSYIQ